MSRVALSSALAIEGALVACFTCLTLFFTWPLADLSQLRLLDSDDAMFSVWRLAWVAHQLPLAPANLFDANIFWPEPNTLAFSDAMLLLGIVALPLIRLGVHPVAAHNLLLLLSFVTAAYACSRLMRYFSPSVPARMVAGTIFAFAPYRFAHIGHLELLWTAFLPIAVLLLLRVLTHPAPLLGMKLGVATALQGLCSLYYLAFMVVWLVPTLLLARLHIRYSLTRRHAAAFTCAIVAASVLLSPYFSPYTQARQDLRPRPVEEVQRYSALPADYLRTPPENWLYGSDMSEGIEERSLFVGTIAFGFALIAVVLIPKRTAAMLSALALIAMDLSFGVNGISYEFLRRMLPGFETFRAPARFGVFVLLPVAILAGLTVARLVAGRAKPWTWIVTASVVAGLSAEYWSAPLVMREVPLEPPPAHKWLAAQPPMVALELPVPKPEALWLFETTYQFRSIYHWRPLVNGYSGFLPQSYAQVLEKMQEFPSQESLAYLRERGVDVVLLNERYFDHGIFDALLLACQDRHWFSEAIVFAETDAGRSAACRFHGR